jgi:hypothetical protein
MVKSKDIWIIVILSHNKLFISIKFVYLNKYKYLFFTKIMLVFYFVFNFKLV